MMDKKEVTPEDLDKWAEEYEATHTDTIVPSKETMDAVWETQQSFEE
jgi:hypothetical protein